MPSNGSHASVQLQYALRASFYLQRSRDSRRAWTPSRLSVSEKQSLDWCGRAEMGISAAAWERVTAAKVEPVAVFCHPDLLARTPDCLDYYTHSAALPKKGIAALARLASAQ